MDVVATVAPRPRVLAGLAVEVITGCGAMYVTLTWQHERLFEIFAILGRSGDCAMAQTGALTRSVSIGLRAGVAADEFAKRLRGIRCPNPHPFPKEEQTWSCPDALAKVLVEFGMLSWEQALSKAGNGAMTAHADPRGADPRDDPGLEEAIVRNQQQAEEFHKIFDGGLNKDA